MIQLLSHSPKMTLTKIHVSQVPRLRPFSMLLTLATIMAIWLAAVSISHAAIDVYDFDSPQQEAQYRGLIEEFRCPKCQNQNLAGSDAPIAQDLKQKTYDMVKDGRTDAEIRQYMQERYGDFISYDPPVRPSTWILWFFPPILLIVVLGGWFWRTHARRAKPVSSTMASEQALTAKEQAALDRLLASRTTNGETTTRVNPNTTSLEEGESK